MAMALTDLARKGHTHPIPGAAKVEVTSDGRKLPSELQDMENLCLWTKRIMRANDVNPDPIPQWSFAPR